MYMYIIYMSCGYITYLSSVLVCKILELQGVAWRMVYMYIQVNEKICNLERGYRDCIKSRRDTIRITRHVMMHQVLYNVHVTLFIGQLHNI